MGVRLNDGASATRRTRKIIARHCIQVREDAGSLLLRVVRTTRQVSRFSGPPFIRTSDRYVSHGIPTVLVIFRHPILRGQFAKVPLVQLLPNACGLRLHAIALRLNHARVLGGESVHATSRAFSRHFNRHGTAPRRCCVCVFEEALRGGIASVATCRVALRSRHVDHL